MARSEARIKTAIWNDEHFRQLPAMAQWGYMLALSQPNVSLCGVVSYTPRRWARLAGDVTPEIVGAAVAELEAERFFVVDEATEELLIRTFIRHDRVLEKPNVLIGMTRDFAAILSPTIRTAVFDELGSDFLKPLAERFGKGFTERLAEPFMKGFTERFQGYDESPYRIVKNTRSDDVSNGSINGSRAHAGAPRAEPPSTATIHHPPSTAVPQNENRSPNGSDDDFEAREFKAPDGVIENVLRQLALRQFHEVRPVVDEAFGQTEEHVVESFMERFRLTHLSKIIRLRHQSVDATWIFDQLTAGDSVDPEEKIGEALLVLTSQDYESAMRDGIDIRDRNAWFKATLQNRRTKHADAMQAQLKARRSLTIPELVVNAGGINPEDPDGSIRAALDSEAERYRMGMAERVVVDVEAALDAFDTMRQKLTQ